MGYFDGSQIVTNAATKACCELKLFSIDLIDEHRYEKVLAKGFKPVGNLQIHYEYNMCVWPPIENPGAKPGNIRSQYKAYRGKSKNEPRRVPSVLISSTRDAEDFQFLLEGYFESHYNITTHVLQNVGESEIAYITPGTTMTRVCARSLPARVLEFKKERGADPGESFKMPRGMHCSNEICKIKQNYEFASDKGGYVFSKVVPVNKANIEKCNYDSC